LHGEQIRIAAAVEGHLGDVLAGNRLAKLGVRLFHLNLGRVFGDLDSGRLARELQRYIHLERTGDVDDQTGFAV
jgi:hypothetical protein